MKKLQNGSSVVLYLVFLVIGIAIGIGFMYLNNGMVPLRPTTDLAVVLDNAGTEAHFFDGKTASKVEPNCCIDKACADRRQLPVCDPKNVEKYRQQQDILVIRKSTDNGETIKAPVSAFPGLSLIGSAWAQGTTGNQPPECWIAEWIAEGIFIKIPPGCKVRNL